MPECVKRRRKEKDCGKTGKRKVGKKKKRSSGSTEMGAECSPVP